ncbi:MAG: tetratricopeptide repeat protein [Elusimicrobia bacterium]|nr:tetratricopeptide repeat protein [Elusimicrobiota bacterium]
MESRLARSWLAPISVGLAATTIYLNTLSNAFTWDDHLLIGANPLFDEQGKSFSSWLMHGSALASARPILMATLAWDGWLWSTRPFGFHLTNLALHGLNSILVYGLTASLWRRRWLAWLSALIFALHPIHTEAVNGIGFRGDLLASLFALSSLWAYALFRRAQSPRRFMALGLALLCFAVSLWAKESAIVVPALAALLDATGTFSSSIPSRHWRRWLFLLAALLTGGYLLLRPATSGYRALRPELPGAAVQTSASSWAFEPSPPQWDLIYRDPSVNLFTMSSVLAEYVRLMVLPYPLRVERAPRVILSATDRSFLWASLMLLSTAGLASLAWSLGHQPLCMGIIWFAIGLLPVSNLIPIFNPMAERYLYLPSVGACWALAYGLSGLGRNAKSSVLLVLLLSSYSALTWRRNADWRDDERLFAREVSGPDQNARVHFNLGVRRHRQGRWLEALESYQNAIQLHPGYVEALTNMAVVYEDLGQEDRSLALLKQAVSLQPRSPLPQELLAQNLERRGQTAAALRSYERAAIDFPWYWPVRSRLGELRATASLP